MKEEFIIRIRNRIKQKKATLKAYEKIFSKEPKNNYILEQCTLIERVISELYNVIDIYRDVEKMKGGIA